MNSTTRTRVQNASLTRPGMASAAALAVGLAALLAPAPAHADSGAAGGPAPLPFGFGLAAGFVSAHIDDEGSTGEADSRFGVNVGAFTHVVVGEYIAIQPELYYAQKGSEFTFFDASIGVDLDYAEVHVLAMGEIPTPSGVIPYAFVGPSVGFLLRAEVTASLDGETESEDISDETAPLELSLIAGAGLRIPTRQHAVTVDIRYQQGVTSIADAEGDATSEERVTNRSFSLMAGFHF